MISILKFTKRNNFVKTGFRLLDLCILSDDIYICTNFCESISKGLQLGWLQLTMGHNSVKL